MQIISRLALLLAPLLLMGGCVTKDYFPVAGGAEDAISEQLDDKEIARILHAAQSLDRTLAKRDQVDANDYLIRYLDSVSNRVFPDYADKIEVRAIKRHELNAFALPNGSIYINYGLLGALENEAQLAAVIAHEGIHYANEHGFKKIKFKEGVDGIKMLSMVLGVPLAGDFVASGIMSGYSQGLEKEADQEGFRRLQAAGYDVREAEKAFNIIAAAAKDAEQRQPLFFSSHPDMVERATHFKALAEGIEIDPVFAYSGDKLYQSVISDIRSRALDMKISMGEYDSAIALLEGGYSGYSYFHLSKYYLAKSYLMKGGPDDLLQAEQHIDDYLGAGQVVPDAYRIKGMVLHKQGDLPAARTYFEFYLKKSPDSHMAGFVRDLLREEI